MLDETGEIGEPAERPSAKPAGGLVGGAPEGLADAAVPSPPGVPSPDAGSGAGAHACATAPSPPRVAPAGVGLARRLAVVVALVALGIGSGVGLTEALGNGGSATTAGPSSATRAAAVGVSATQPDVAAIAAKVDPAIVDVNATLDYGQGRAAGTGMILTPSGEVLTNNHVVDGATSIRVTVAGTGPTYRAVVVGVDPTADVALLRIEGAPRLPTVTLGNSSTVTVGEPVVAIGNALGLSGPPTVTEGTVTALDRSITAGDPIGGAEHLTGLIQADAPLSPGNSGGPLLDASGQVIGMNTAAYAGGSTGPASNVGFAIPINRALAVVRAIEAHDTSAGVLVGPRPLLGVEVVDAGGGPFAGGGFGGFGGGAFAPGSADAVLPSGGGTGEGRGAVVVGVLPGGPADAAGIVPGDVIVGFDGRTVRSAARLGELVQDHSPGQRVEVQVVDPSGGTETLAVVLGTGPAA
jgi:S1-C subfamily serine protease